MAEVLVGTDNGCRVFSEQGSSGRELPGRSVGPFAAESGGGCLAIVDQREIWRRSAEGEWVRFAVAEIKVQSVLCNNGAIYLGGMDEATLLSVDGGGGISHMRGFDHVPGRDEWFAGGPPLGVRSLASADGGKTLLAAVHVGGIPRTRDGGRTWRPTIPVMFDVHEVSSHPSLPNIVAAAAAVGLCVSRDGGEQWEVFAPPVQEINSLAVAVRESDILFSLQEGPFAQRSQLWRCAMDDMSLEPVREGLPEWLEGKIDTAQISVGRESAAVCDGGGNLWFSSESSGGWHRIARDIGYAHGLLLTRA